eukprot:COSAG01_NODE_10506_length_2149_cov_5.011707_4_plen_100_part_00
MARLWWHARGRSRCASLLAECIVLWVICHAALLLALAMQGSSTATSSQHARAVAGKSKQTQRVYSSVQGILRTLVQRGIFVRTGCWLGYQHPLPLFTCG